MHNNLKNYSLNTGTGTQIGFEYDRVNALTGRRPEDYLINAPTNRLGLQYTLGCSRQSAKMQTLLSESRLYVIDYNGQVMINIMTDNAYNMIRRPEMSVLKKVSLADAIRTMAAGVVPDATSTNQYARNYLIHSTVYQEHVALAQVLQRYLSITERILTANADKSGFAEVYPVIFNYDASVTDIILYSDGIALKSLAAIAIQAAAVINSEYWAFSFRSAWEELVQVGNSHRKVNELYMHLAGPERSANVVDTVLSI